MTELLRRQRTRGITAERIAAEFSVSVRTVKRDLQALETAGLPIWSRTGPGGGFGLSERGNLPPISLTAPQAVALLAATAAAGASPFADLARAAVRKVLDVLDPVTRDQALLLAERVWVDAGDLPPRATMSAIETALAEQLVVRIDYVDGSGNHTRRDVEPMLFASTGGRWYLVAWCRLRDAVRWFALDRIRRATITRTPCTGHPIGDVGTPPATATTVAP